MERLARRVCVAGGLLALALALACLDTQLVPCGDLRCPRGTTCVADELCAAADQLTACVGVEQDGASSFAGGVGRCDRGVCIATGCGNGVVDPGEKCDDGNAVGGDGCSADCGKLELCGDSVADKNEGCDDGNANPADGCDACVPTRWTATAVIGGNANATTIALAAPAGVAVDRGGNVFISDTNYHRIRRVDATGVVTTIAGTGVSGFGGDGAAATNAQLGGPRGVAVDGLGNVYVADTNNHRIRRIDSLGVITTVAGTGIPGFGGDNAPAVNARLAAPQGVAVDGLGNLYIADADNNRIRRVSLSGIITTISGNGVAAFGGDGGPASAAQLAYPRGVAVDSSGRLYIADTANCRLRRIETNGMINTLAGTGAFTSSGDGGPAASAEINPPQGVALDASNNIYVIDGFSPIRRIDAITGTITRVAGTNIGGYSGDGGPAITAMLNYPRGVAVDGAGRILIADTNNHRIRRVDASGMITTFAGTGAAETGDGRAATAADLSPSGLAAHADKLYVAEGSNHRVRRVDANGVIATVAGTGSVGFAAVGTAAITTELAYPSDLAVDAGGNLYIVDSGNNRIMRVDPVTGVITTVAGSPGSFGGDSGDGGPATGAQLRRPQGVDIDGAGNVYIADRDNHRIKKIDLTGVIRTVAGIGTPGFSGDGGPATSAEIRFPESVINDGAGGFYFTALYDYRVRHVDAVGTITTVVGDGTISSGGDGGPAIAAQLSLPLAVDRDALGRLVIADGARIRRVSATGIITTISGTGVSGNDGDGGPASTAQPLPGAITFDGAGDLYVADAGTRRVRRIDASGVITTVAGRIEPEGMGPIAQARLGDPRAILVAAPFSLIAGGASGTVQAARTTTMKLEVVAGRYPQDVATSTLARFRDRTFGTVSGIAYDAAAGAIYLSESSANRIHVVTIVDPADENTWTIAPLANAAGTASFADGAALSARFRQPAGLYLDTAAHLLYVADTGNHVIRSIDLSSGVAAAMVRTVAGVPATRGFTGDGAAATAALLHAPQAITRCANGDLFVADTGNHRVRRIAAAGGAISTVLGVGVAASSGEGRPASTFPVDSPLGLACDQTGNLFVTSTTVVRLVPADASGIVDGTGNVATIYGAVPRDTFPASVTTCLTGLAIVDATAVQVTDSCTGLLVELRRSPE